MRNIFRHTTYMQVNGHHIPAINTIAALLDVTHNMHL